MLSQTNQPKCSDFAQMPEQSPQCEGGAQALLHITVLYVCVATARAHPALLCSHKTKAYTIANVVAHCLMDSSLTSS